MPRPRVHDEALRIRLIEAAAEVLAAEGPQAISTRRIAHEVGTSTSAIYTLLGSKSEMVRAVYLEGFSRLGERQAAVEPSDDPVTDLRALGFAYFDNGLANPNLYEVMFHRPLAGFIPEPDDVVFALGTLQQVVEAVQRAIDADRMHGVAPEIATELWVLVHGITSLTIAGMLDPEQARARLESLIAITTAGYEHAASSTPA